MLLGHTTTITTTTTTTTTTKPNINVLQHYNTIISGLWYLPYITIQATFAMLMLVENWETDKYIPNMFTYDKIFS